VIDSDNKLTTPCSQEGTPVRKLLPLVVLALAAPSFALAAKPPTPTNNGKAAPKVLYVLRGTLTAYTAANGSSNGSVSILVKAANHGRATLKTQTLTFPLSSHTKVVTPDGAALTVNDKGIVKVRGPKKITPTDLASTLQALTAFQVIDQGPPS
jgi:hypothetical protein